MARARRGSRDADNERGGRGSGRGDGGGRGGGRRGDGGFGAMLLVGMLIFLAVTGGAVWAWSATRENTKAQEEAMNAAYSDWLQDSKAQFTQRVGAVATSLAPIYNDTPTEKQTPELIAALSQKYGPTLTGTGASYAWCKKSWSIKGQNYGANISPGNASEFMMMPANCTPLGESFSLSNINGQVTMSGAVSFYYDRDDSLPKAVVSLNLGPPPAAAADGEGPPKTVSPTSFTLWFLMSEPTGEAKKALYQKMHPKLE